MPIRVPHLPGASKRNMLFYDLYALCRRCGTDVRWNITLPKKCPSCRERRFIRRKRVEYNPQMKGMSFPEGHWRKKFER